MRLLIAAVGQMKEPFYREAQEEYAKRIGRYARLSIVEVADEPLPLGEQERLAVKEREGERLLKRVPAGFFKVALDPRGEELSSEGFAAWLKRRMNSGRADIAFLVGGTLGLSEAVLRGSDFVLSLSRLTFPHQLARLIILEQIYRAFRIIRNEPYHY